MGSKEASTAAGRALTVIGLARVIELAVREAGVSPARFRALSAVKMGVSASDLLARFLGVTPSTVTTVMDGLVDRGLVVREAREGDRRRVDYALTSEGERAIASANQVAVAALDEMAQYVEPSARAAALASFDDWGRAIEARRDHWGDE